MAFELVDSTATGKFVKTLFGSDATQTPKKVDVNQSGVLSDLNKPSVISVDSANSKAFSVITPTDLKQLETDPQTNALAISKGTTPLGMVEELILRAPRAVTSLKGLFEDGTINISDANSAIDRLLASIPRNMYDSLDNFTFLSIFKNLNYFDRANSEGGCNYSDKVNSDNRLNLGYKDESISAAFILANLLGSFADSLCSDILAGIDVLTDKLGLGPVAKNLIKKKAAIELAKVGGKAQIVGLLDDIGINNFTPQERLQIDMSLRREYKKRPNLSEADKIKEAKELLDLGLELIGGIVKPGFGIDIIDIGMYQEASRDWIDVVSRDRKKGFLAIIGSSDSVKPKGSKDYYNYTKI